MISPDHSEICSEACDFFQEFCADSLRSLKDGSVAEDLAGDNFDCRSSRVLDCCYNFAVQPPVNT